MAYDILNTFSDQQEITVDAASTKSIEMEAAGSYGNVDIDFDIKVTEDFAGNFNLSVKLQLSNKKDFSGTLVHESTLLHAIPVAKLKVGTLYSGTIPRNFKWQYARLYYDTSGTFTAGKVFAGVFI